MKIIASVEIRVSRVARSCDRYDRLSRLNTRGRGEEEESFPRGDSSSADLRSAEEWWRNRAITLGWFNDRLSIGKSFPRLCLPAGQNFFERSVVAFARHRHPFRVFHVRWKETFRRLRSRASDT